MRISHTDYLELPAPVALTWNALRDPAVWAALPTGAEQLGETWYWEHELYTVVCEEVRPNPPPSVSWLRGSDHAGPGSMRA